MQIRILGFLKLSAADILKTALGAMLRQIFIINNIIWHKGTAKT